jgi:hypothetical protein
MIYPTLPGRLIRHHLWLLASHNQGWNKKESAVDIRSSK